MTLKNRCVRCFNAVSIKTRFQMFQFLKKQKDGATISELTEYTSLKQPTVSFHINKLTETGLIRKYKQGREVYCKVSITCSDCPLN